jgi:hypothetical protein
VKSGRYDICAEFEVLIRTGKVNQREWTEEEQELGRTNKKAEVRMEQEGTTKPC